MDDQLEVSEWTLPGPSVGEVTEEGVGASCQPPFAFDGKKKVNVLKCSIWSAFQSIEHWREINLQ